jgi:hypothetical protein
MIEFLTMAFSVLSDAPVKAGRDLLDFQRYSQPLISVLTSDTLDTPFTIGIFGRWGSGKSTLIEILQEELQARKEGWRFLTVKFNPWMFRKEPNLLVPLLNALHDALAKDPREMVKASASKVFDVLIHLAADVLLKKLTAGAVDLDRLDKLEKAYLTRRGQIDSQIANLHSCLEEIAVSLEGQKLRIVFFIDDLDRCDPANIIDVLESMKLFLDVRNIVHILALDKEVIDRGIEVAYGKFSFGERQRAMGAEYLDKMIQMPVYLFPLHSTQVRGYIHALDNSDAVISQTDLLVATLEPNPRKIKRVLNMLALTNSIMQSDSKRYSGFDRYVTTALAIIRVQEPALYMEAARLPRLLVALEDVYGGKRSVRDSNDFIDFGQKAEAVRALCATFFQPVGMLPAIFKPRKEKTAGGAEIDVRRFGPVAGSLENYLSAVGGC